MPEEVQDHVWPLPRFFFMVGIAGQQVAFREVSGLDMEAQTIEYRHDNSPGFRTIRMPGLRKSGNVILKKGVFKGDNAFWDWFNLFKSNTIERKMITINLLDNDNNPSMTWTLNNAWPTKITGTDLKADGNEVAVETIELAHEGIVISNS